jgi:hypothetical protein
MSLKYNDSKVLQQTNGTVDEGMSVKKNINQKFAEIATSNCLAQNCGNKIPCVLHARGESLP